MNLLVCGGRDCSRHDVWNWLERNAYLEIAHATRCHSVTLEKLIHGGARGADEGAADWGRSEGIKVISYPANWRKHGKSAGPIRNQKMLDEGKPDIVMAFPGGKGTADMMRRAEAAGIPVIQAGSTPSYITGVK
ncbi:MAG: DUF2493 domain-containing protein [Hyphomicrobiales bacterium]|nr:DUF2493 domain-containing protein [Hyphomicrobiales bacterium]